MSSVLALITTYNEADSLPYLIRSFRYNSMPVCVVDDCSTDGTAEIARQADICISPPRRLGIANCLYIGYSEALKRGYDHLLQIDAGGSHDPYQIPRFLDLADQADLVIGSRYLPGSAYLGNPTRRQMSRLAAYLCSRKTGIPITDWTSGYRLFSRAALQAIVLPVHSRMHGYQIETLYSILRAGLKVAEVPITYQAGRSSFNRKTAFEAFRVWRSLKKADVYQQTEKV